MNDECYEWYELDEMEIQRVLIQVLYRRRPATLPEKMQEKMPKTNRDIA